eukprot:COSAG01_NODE_4408_length_5059_cov_2.693565_2_plen_78_part_00
MKTDMVLCFHIVERSPPATGYRLYTAGGLLIVQIDKRLLLLLLTHSHVSKCTCSRQLHFLGGAPWNETEPQPPAPLT